MMTLDEAIKALEDLLGLVDEDSEVNHMDAVKLGIEALNWRQIMEHDYGSWVGPLLPGETKVINVIDEDPFLAPRLRQEFPKDLSK